jgi:hypothetical protein
LAPEKWAKNGKQESAQLYYLQGKKIDPKSLTTLETSYHTWKYFCSICLNKLARLFKE